MNRAIALSAVLVVVLPALSFAAQAGGVVESIQFATSATAPVYVVPKSLKKSEPLFRAGLQTLPESLLVVGALIAGSGDLDLSSKQATNLASLMTDTYTKINADAAFRDTPSALPYCFSTKKQTTGHYFLYRPEKIPKDPVCIVFLHGYGGNFQFYMWVLKEEFPDAIILAPSWGVSWAGGSAIYLKDMLADAERRTGVALGKPWLMAISAGGRGGFSIYNQMPTGFSGYVCLAWLPGTSVVRRLRRDLKILMLNGTADEMVPIALARKQAKLARKAVPTLIAKEIDGSHFFLLSKRKETFDTIKKFMKDE
jgi:predicted esterase